MPLRTVSEANSSEHWHEKSRRHRKQQFFIRQAYEKYVHFLELPCIVTFTRLGPRFLDEDDNLPMAFKYIKDELSECILPEFRSFYVNKNGKKIKIKGRADSDPRIKWKFAQEKSSIHGIRVEIEFDKGNIQNDAIFFPK